MKYELDEASNVASSGNKKQETQERFELFYCSQLPWLIELVTLNYIFRLYNPFYCWKGGFHDMSKCNSDSPLYPMAYTSVSPGLSVNVTLQ